MRAYSISPRPVASAPAPRRRRNPSSDDCGRAINAHVAKRIKLLRRINGVTQTELGAVIGMTFQQMAKCERGISKVAPDKLWKLAEHFGVEITYFFDGLDHGTAPCQDALAPSADGSLGNRRLRLELAGAVQEMADKNMMRSLLELIRVSAE
jgi:transcriptional regulator with XRE-family HTH domain